MKSGNPVTVTLSDITETGSGVKIIELSVPSGISIGGTALIAGVTIDSQPLTDSDTRITLNLASGSVISGSSVTKEITGLTVSGGDGATVTVTAKLTDAAGKHDGTASVKTSNSLTIDDTAPVFGSGAIKGSATPAAVNNTEIDYTIPVTETGSGLASITVDGFTGITKVTLGGSTDAVSGYTASVISFTGAPKPNNVILSITGTVAAGAKDGGTDGQRTIKVTAAADIVENTVSTDTGAVTVLLDTTAPGFGTGSLDGTGVVTGYTKAVGVTYEVSITEGASGLQKVTVNGLSNIAVAGDSGISGTVSGQDISFDGESGGNLKITGDLASGDGSKTVSIDAEDQAGNSDSGGSATITLDTIGPTISGTLSFTNDLVAGTIGDLTIDDAGAGADYDDIEIIVDYSDSSSDTSLTVANDGTISGIDVLKLASLNETATLTLNAGDALGNPSSTYYIQVKRTAVTTGDPSDFTVTGPQTTMTFSASFPSFSFFSAGTGFFSGGGRTETASTGNRSGSTGRSAPAVPRNTQAASTGPAAPARTGRAETVTNIPAAFFGIVPVSQNRSGPPAVNSIPISYETVREAPASRTGSRLSSPAARRTAERGPVDNSSKTLPREDDAWYDTRLSGEIPDPAPGKEPEYVFAESFLYSPGAPAFTGLLPVPAPVNVPKEPRDKQNIPIRLPFINNVEEIPLRRSREDQDQDLT
jgi:hypothetical protein